MQKVTPGSPAAKAGIRGGTIPAQVDGYADTFYLGGDIITAVDGKPVRSADDVTALVTGKKRGDQVTLHVITRGKGRDVQLTLGERPADLPLDAGGEPGQP